MLAYFTSMGDTMTKEQEKGYFNWKEQADDGSYYDDIQLYGMDAFPLQKVKALKGDVTALDQENAMAAGYAGLIAVADTLKEDSPQAVAELRDKGIRVIMLTGDNERTANAIGAQAGVDEVIAGVLPEG